MEGTQPSLPEDFEGDNVDMLINLEGDYEVFVLGSLMYRFDVLDGAPVSN